MVRRWWVVGATPDGRTSLQYSQTRLQGLGEEASACVRSGLLSSSLRYWGLLIYGDSWCADPLRLGVRGRTRRGEGNCKSTYIRSRRACDKFASTQCLFGRMATWGRDTLQFYSFIFLKFFIFILILILYIFLQVINNYIFFYYHLFLKQPF